MHDVERTANLLGAAALALTDLMFAELAHAGGLSASGAAALVTLGAAPDLSVTELGRRVGLSQPAAARMVDGLERRAFARRAPGAGREVSVRLTPAGEGIAARLTGARTQALAGPLAALDQGQLAALDGALSGLLAALYRRVGSADLLCRLCDRERCTRGAPCPVGQAGREVGQAGRDVGEAGREVGQAGRRVGQAGRQ
ncbi:hypothetical protein GCM10023321_08870 [Pseudonocardia eucalypti]|uniref:HTH marR-type domain-containing protein n=1 Tax=Pseudonocardia eucalypti TaxID=648755 RepID=A0ABP9PJQ0_9PSEU|nr:DNA-binding MarR family transcriptional regulator [Pseudonocardia eucalypti]